MALQLLKYNNQLIRYNNGILKWDEGVAPEPPPGPPSGYIALYKFEDNVNDDTGTYTGTAQNSPSYATGKVGNKCIVLNGSNQYVDTNIPSSLFRYANSVYSWAIWVKFTSTSRGKICMANTNAGSCCLGINENGGNGKIEAELSGGQVETTNAYNDGNWHLIVASKNSNVSNGSFLDIDNGTEHIVLTGSAGADYNANLTIGRHGTYNGVYYGGSIDQFYIYDKALSIAEVSQLWNGGAGI